jgi:four helix bundle protein
MQDLKQRTFGFAVNVGKLALELSYNQLNKQYIGQLVRSSSSVGANYRAARRAKSDADFINKLKIVEEEADESVYFLELLRVINPALAEKITSLVEEGTAILKIIVTSINTTRARINSK